MTAVKMRQRQWRLQRNASKEVFLSYFSLTFLCFFSLTTHFAFLMLRPEIKTSPMPEKACFMDLMRAKGVQSTIIDNSKKIGNFGRNPFIPEEVWDRKSKAAKPTKLLCSASAVTTLQYLKAEIADQETKLIWANMQFPNQESIDFDLINSAMREVYSLLPKHSVLVVLLGEDTTDETKQYELLQAQLLCPRRAPDYHNFATLHTENTPLTLTVLSHFIALFGTVNFFFHVAHS